MRHNIRSRQTGRFVQRKLTPIVAGGLYDYRGTVVRARKKCNNDLWFVSAHKKLNGFVRPEELSKIDKATVKAYLANA
jgi:hypothetical protein